MSRFTISLLAFLGTSVVTMTGRANAEPYPAGDAEKGQKVLKNACRAT